jgi:phosphate transport system permease protein
VYYLVGATPRAEDASRYPVILAPVLLALGVYAVLVIDLVVRARQELTDPTGIGPRIFIQPYIDPSMPPAFVRQAGLLNQLLGTGLLMLLTTLISLPIGVGTGIFVSEFARDWERRVVSLCTTTLRGISALLIALAAVAVVTGSKDQPWLPFLAGYYFDAETLRTEHGSFLLASIALSALVIPIITRATEIGLSSLPRDLREGSAALGARPEYTLVRITLPWAVPNIVTSVILGCAEAAGSVSVLMFIAGTGTRGVGPFEEVTSLAFGIFYSQFSPFKAFRDLERPYQYAAALELLVLALALTGIALIFKRRYASRYQGV